MLSTLNKIVLYCIVLYERTMQMKDYIDSKIYLKTSRIKYQMRKYYLRYKYLKCTQVVAKRQVGSTTTRTTAHLENNGSHYRLGLQWKHSERQESWTLQSTSTIQRRKNTTLALPHNAHCPFSPKKKMATGSTEPVGRGEFYAPSTVSKEPFH